MPNDHQTGSQATTSFSIDPQNSQQIQYFVSVIRLCFQLIVIFSAHPKWCRPVEMGMQKVLVLLKFRISFSWVLFLNKVIENHPFIYLVWPVCFKWRRLFFGHSRGRTHSWSHSNWTTHSVEWSESANSSNDCCQWHARSIYANTRRFWVAYYIPFYVCTFWSIWPLS